MARAEPPPESSEVSDRVEEVGSEASDDTEAEPSEAEPRGDATAGTEDESPPELGPSVEAIDERRRRIVDLVRGEPLPGVDVGSLLSIELTDDAVLDADDLETLMEAVARARDSGTPAPLPEDVERPSRDRVEARARLVEALAAFLGLDASERRARLEAHRAAAEDARRVEVALRERLARATKAKAQLDAFVAGTLEPEVDPRPLLRIDLAEAPTEIDRGGLDEVRREVEAVERALVDARLALLRRPAQERRALLSAHEARAEPEPEPESEPEPEPVEPTADVEEAQQAAAAVAREREQALAEAKSARSKALRELAAERARLLGIKEDQARFEVELAERRAQATADHEVARTWARRVDDVAVALEAFAEPAEDPDSMYPRLREELQQARDHLGEALGVLVARTSHVPRPGALGALSPDVDPEEVRALHRALVTDAERLEQQERELQWVLADGYRDDIVSLDDSRLRLLAGTTESLRDAVTGFGPEGVRQVAGEIEQIGLELRYRALSLPRQGMALLDDLRTSPVPLLVGLLQLVLLGLVLRWWRRRAPELLTRLSRDGDRPRRGPVAELAWYLARIRRPLEWLLVAAVIVHGTSAMESFPELRLVWLVMLWLLLGSASILLVDAIAAREHRRQGGPSATAPVRIRSLRLIGLSVAYTGLVLSLADAFVGKGAIYAWVLGTCWLLLVPISLLLTRWWREPVLERYGREPDTRLARWVLARREGWVSYPTVMIGGIALVARGTWRWAIRRAARFEGTQHLLAYLFRREVARQAAVTGRSEHVEPAEPELRARFVEPVGVDAMIDEVHAAELDRLEAAIASPGATFCVVVGERGLGKSTLLARLRRRHDGSVLSVQCPASGWSGLVSTLAEELGAPSDAGPEVVAERLAERGPLLVTLDDIQRLVQPTIGGMAGLDELGRLARRAGPEVSWVGSVGAAAWQYVSRARGDRLHFDEVLRLGAWDEAGISSLMEHRCAALGVRPSFDGLVIPRQYDDDELEADRRSEIGYYRILWDYSAGNPHVASWFWAESLFRDDESTLVVRLFREPPAAELDALPLTLQFVLRALVQLETATRSELSAAIRMPPSEIDDALRFARGRGYVDEDDGVFALSWPWYRAVTRMLHRQHLLTA